MSIRRRLEHGFYEVANNLSRSEYVLKLLNDVKALDHYPDEAYIVQCLSLHFDESVRAAILTRGINSLTQLLSVLDAFENTQALNSSLENARRESFRNQSYERTRNHSSNPPQLLSLIHI